MITKLTHHEVKSIPYQMKFNQGTATNVTSGGGDSSKINFLVIGRRPLPLNPEHRLRIFIFKTHLS